MNESIRFRPDEIRSSRHETIRGVDIEVWPSPYDIPTIMTVNRSKSTNKLEILFKYMGEQETITSTQTVNDIVVTLGAKSRRIYQISLPGGDRPSSIQRPTDIPEVVGSALDTMEKNGLFQDKSLNYIIVKEILVTMKDDIFGVGRDGESR